MSTYVQLAEFKQYFPITFPSGSSGSSADDTTLQQSLDRAEGEFNRIADTNFNQQTLVNEYPTRAWVDRNGMVTISARTTAPITSVTSIQYLLPPIPTWQSLSWDPANGIFLPDPSDPPRQWAWQVQVLPLGTPLMLQAADNIFFRWSYTGGYASPPSTLKALILRMAMFLYKLREAPLGRLNSQPGMMSQPAIIRWPDDLQRSILVWQRPAV